MFLNTLLPKLATRKAIAAVVLALVVAGVGLLMGQAVASTPRAQPSAPVAQTGDPPPGITPTPPPRPVAATPMPWPYPTWDPTSFDPAASARLRAEALKGGTVGKSDPRQTMGTTVRIAGQDIKLPADAYYVSGDGFVFVRDEARWPLPPVHTIHRGNSKIRISGTSGEVVLEEIASGEEVAFAFLDPVRKPPRPR